MPRRSGDKNQFWDAVVVGANGTSTAVELPRAMDSLALYITTSGATTITLQASHSGDITAEGLLPDTNSGTWADVTYIDVPIQKVFAGAGSAVILIPDFVPGWIRLFNLTAGVTITAGWETID